MASNRPQRPVPLLLCDIETGYPYATARHMAVFLRYDLGIGDVGDDDRILTRLVEIGGVRKYAELWDVSTRKRQDKVRLVLFGCPRTSPMRAWRSADERSTGTEMCPGVSPVEIDMRARVRQVWDALGHGAAAERTTTAANTARREMP